MNSAYIRHVAIAILLVVVAYTLFRLVGLLGTVFELMSLTVLLAITLNPLVNRLQTYGVPRKSAVLIVMLLLLLVLTGLLWFLIPPFIEQFRQLLLTFPAFWDRYQLWIVRLAERYPNLVNLEQIQQLPSRLLLGLQQYLLVARTVFTSTVGLLTGFIIILVATLYALINPYPLLYGIRGLFPTDWWSKIEELAVAIAQRIHGWVLGVLALGFLIGTLDYIALLIINFLFGPDIPFILFFAILGGVLEVIPVLGPLIAVTLPLLVALALDPYMAIAVLIAYILIQQLENHIAAPLIMHKAVNLHPVTIIFTLATMAALFGIFGALIAVPVAAIVKVLYDKWYYPLLHDNASPLPAPAAHDVAPQNRPRWYERWQQKRATRKTEHRTDEQE